jgi:hypothetical protein
VVATAKRIAALWLGVGALLGGCGASHPPATRPIVFREVAAAAGLPTASEPCLVFSDLDGDGRPDLLLAPVDAGGQFAGQLGIYRNRGDGTFEAHMVPVALSEILGCSAGDLDKDGFADLIVSGRSAAGGDSHPVLLRHRAGFDYDDASQQIQPLVGPATRVVGIADLDGDGWPDLVASSYDSSGAERDLSHCDATADGLQCYTKQPAPGVPPVLLHNRNGQGFDLVSAAFPSAGLTNGVFFDDWDGDGRLDVFVCNDFGPNQFYRNTVSGMMDWLSGWNANPYNHCRGVAFPESSESAPDSFYIANLGSDQFWMQSGDGVVDRNRDLGIAEATRLHSGWSPIPADFNHDGLIDLFVVNAGLVGTIDDLITLAQYQPPPPPPLPQADFVFAQQPGGGFTVSPVPHRANVPWVSTGSAAAADYDRDGWIDIAVVVAPQSPEMRLLHNESQ